MARWEVETRESAEAQVSGIRADAMANISSSNNLGGAIHTDNIGTKSGEFSGTHPHFPARIAELMDWKFTEKLIFNKVR